MWAILFSMSLALVDAAAIYLLCRLLTSVVPSQAEGWVFTVATAMLQCVIALALPQSIWIPPLVAAIPAITAVIVLRLNWRAGTLLAIINWLARVAATTSMTYLLGVAGISPSGVGGTLLTAVGYWIAIAGLGLVLRHVGRQAGKRWDLQVLRSLPLPILAIFALSVYNFWAAQQAPAPPGLALPIKVTAVTLALIGLWQLFVSFRSLSQSQENAELRFYLQTIETLTLELRQFRHNYRNILHGLAGYIENHEWDQLMAYFRDVVRETEQAELHSYALALKNVTNYALFGLLSEKLQYARQAGVEMDLSVMGIFGRTVMTPTDLCQVIGIFLDNAIEAAQEAPDGKVLITLRYDGSYQQVAITNDCAKIPSLSKAATGGYSSKGPGRGSGLYYAKRVLQRYDQVLHNTIYADGEFRQELIIPIEGSE